MWTLFVTVAADAPLNKADISDVRSTVQAMRGVVEARIMVPDATPSHQPFAADGRGPELALQLTFASRAAADAALSAPTPLAHLDLLQRLPKARVAHQLMQGRSFATGSRAPTDPCLTFFVTYPGTAQDIQHWLDHYDANHPPIMVRFPGIREVETHRPVAWSSSWPFEQENVLQRNKVVFDSFADLVAALASPVMLEMRADGKAFPPFTGKATHFPMTTWRVAGSGDSGST